MQGAAWTTSTNWGSTTVSHCQWYGVLCCDASTHTLPSAELCESPGAVLGVALPGNNLRGTIPATFLSGLQSLFALDLRG